jgi:hypothetical protein
MVSDLLRNRYCSIERESSGVAEQGLPLFVQTRWRVLLVASYRGGEIMNSRELAKVDYNHVLDQLALAR